MSPCDLRSDDFSSVTPNDRNDLPECQGNRGLSEYKAVGVDKAPVNEAVEWVEVLELA